MYISVTRLLLRSRCNSWVRSGTGKAVLDALSARCPASNQPCGRLYARVRDAKGLQFAAAILLITAKSVSVRHSENRRIHHAWSGFESRLKVVDEGYPIYADQPSSACTAPNHELSTRLRPRRNSASFAHYDAWVILPSQETPPSVMLDSTCRGISTRVPHHTSQELCA